MKEKKWRTIRLDPLYRIDVIGCLFSVFKEIYTPPLQKIKLNNLL